MEDDGEQSALQGREGILEMKAAVWGHQQLDNGHNKNLLARH